MTKFATLSTDRQDRAIKRFSDSWTLFVNSPKPTNYYASDQNRADDALKALITTLPHYDADTQKLTVRTDDERNEAWDNLAEGDPSRAIETLYNTVREYYAAQSPLAKALALIGTIDELHELTLYHSRYDTTTDSIIE